MVRKLNHGSILRPIGARRQDTPIMAGGVGNSGSWRSWFPYVAATAIVTLSMAALRLDCDGDTVLVRVEQAGGACHTGDRTCFDADVLLNSGP